MNGYGAGAARVGGQEVRAVKRAVRMYCACREYGQHLNLYMEYIAFKNRQLLYRTPLIYRIFYINCNSVF